MDYMTLIGSEDVSRAGARMIEAAESIQSSVNQLEEALHRHRVWADDWLLHTLRREEWLKRNGD